MRNEINTLKNNHKTKLEIEHVNLLRNKGLTLKDACLVSNITVEHYRYNIKKLNKNEVKRESAPKNKIINSIIKNNSKSDLKLKSKKQSDSEFDSESDISSNESSDNSEEKVIKQAKPKAAPKPKPKAAPKPKPKAKPKPKPKAQPKPKPKTTNKQKNQTGGNIDINTDLDLKKKKIDETFIKALKSINDNLIENEDINSD